MHVAQGAPVQPGGAQPLLSMALSQLAAGHLSSPWWVGGWLGREHICAGPVELNAFNHMGNLHETPLAIQAFSYSGLLFCHKAQPSRYSRAAFRLNTLTQTSALRIRYSLKAQAPDT